MLRRVWGVVTNRDPHNPPTIHKKLQYILVGDDYESRYTDFVAAVTLIVWTVITFVLILSVYSNWTAICYGCETCRVPENECGDLVKTFSGDVFCTSANTYLRPTISFYSIRTTTEPINNLCSNRVCHIQFADNVKINYTNTKTGLLTETTLNHADSQCLQRLLLFRSHLFNCRLRCSD